MCRLVLIMTRRDVLLLQQLSQQPETYELFDDVILISAGKVRM